MIDASLAIQQAIYTALTADGTLTALITGVFDSVPEKTAYPYVTIGDDTSKPWDSCVMNGQEFTITLHTWSRDTGRKNTKTIMKNIYRILHRAALTLSGSTMISCLFEFGQTFLDPDGVTYHGVQRFRMLVQEG